MYQINRNEVYMADLNGSNTNNGTKSSVQVGHRPVLVISNDMNNKYSTVITVVPLTSSTSKKDLPTHVKLSKSCGLDRESTVLCEQILTIPKEKLHNKLCSLTGDIIKKINTALSIQLAM